MDDFTWTNVGPGLWSAAEVEVLVMSANLPLMSPIVRLLRPGKFHKHTYKDEENKSILELDSMESKTKRVHLDHAGSVTVPKPTFVTTAEGMANK
ncbi:MAG: hypothetical protein Q9219_006185 [cf. Caloplaca sp. 3 TL-2023]